MPEATWLGRCCSPCTALSTARPAVSVRMAHWHTLSCRFDAVGGDLQHLLGNVDPDDAPSEADLALQQW